MTKLPYVLTLLVVLVATCVAWMAWRSGTGPSVGSMTVPDEPSTDDVPAERLTEFTLDERGGEPFDSDRLRGKVWVASFFFTTCAGSCIQLNQALQTLHDDPALGDVTFVSISCDPENDTIEALADYAQRFGADGRRWLFCRGPLDYVQQIGRDVMQLAVERQTHSDRAVVLDRTGAVRGRFRVTEPNQMRLMERLIVTCLEQPAPPDASHSARTSPVAHDSDKNKKSLVPRPDVTM